MTRREEIAMELQELDRRIYALQNDRAELQKQYDETPDTQAGKNAVEDSFHEQLKAYAAGLEGRGIYGSGRDAIVIK